MNCMICKKEVIANKHRHNPRVLCSAKCRKIRHNQVAAEFKKTQKGILSEMRWRNNPIKKLIDKNYRQTENGRKKNVLRIARYKENSEYAQSETPRLNRLYRLCRINKSGKYAQWWKQQSSLGCAHCGSFERLSIDHKVARMNGGTDEISNLQVLCIVCNGKKLKQDLNYASVLSV